MLTCCQVSIRTVVYNLNSNLFVAGTVTTNLILYRTCYVSLNYNESECALLGKDYSSNTTKELETLVQPHATKILMSSVIISAILPPIMCFFFGPWTDVYGRKPLLLTTLAGNIINLQITINLVFLIFGRFHSNLCDNNDS